MQHPVLQEFIKYENLLLFLEEQKKKYYRQYPVYEFDKNTYVNHKCDIMLHARWAFDTSRIGFELDILIGDDSTYIINIDGKSEIIAKDQKEVDDIIIDYLNQNHFITCYAIHIPYSVYDIMKQTGIKFYQTYPFDEMMKKTGINVEYGPMATIGNKKTSVYYDCRRYNEFKIINNGRVTIINYQNKKVTKLTLTNDSTTGTDLTKLYDEQKITEMAMKLLIDAITRCIIENILPPKLHPILDKLPINQKSDNQTNHTKFILYDNNSVMIVFKSGLTSLEYCFTTYKDGDYQYGLSKILKMDAFGHREVCGTWTYKPNVNSQCEDILKLVNHE